MTRKHFAVIGSPIEHSLSPKIHSAAYQFLGLDWDYTGFEVKEDGLSSFLATTGSHLAGISVTMPLKNEAAAIATSSDSIVEKLGVANTLLKTQAGYSAYNTDVFGIQQALAGAWVEGMESIAILGAGATAQSALYAASANSPDAKVAVYARDVSRTEAMSSLAASLGVTLEIRELSSFSNSHNLTISTIPSSALDDLVAGNKDGWFLNASYSSKDSTFTKQFRAERAVAGETMLIWQAIAQIRIFLTGSANVDIDNEAGLFAKMSGAL
jgi:shikimate dehydrogenase